MYQADVLKDMDKPSSGLVPRDNKWAKKSDLFGASSHETHGSHDHSFYGRFVCAWTSPMAQPDRHSQEGLSLIVWSCSQDLSSCNSWRMVCNILIRFLSTGPNKCPMTSGKDARTTARQLLEGKKKTPSAKDRISHYFSGFLWSTCSFCPLPILKSIPQV